MKQTVTQFSLCRRALSVGVWTVLGTASGLAGAQDASTGSGTGPEAGAVSEADADSGAFSTGQGGRKQPGVNRLSDRGELDRIIELYLAGRYQPCAEQLGAYLNPKNSQRFADVAVIERGRLYFASCALLQGQHDLARAALRKALEQNPLMQSPDSLTFPPPVVSLFLEERDQVQELIAEREKEQVFELRRENERARRLAQARLQREQQLEKMAREEVVISQNSRWLAAVPLGVGQFQNGDTGLGTLFLVTEGLLGATVIGSAYAMKINNGRIADSGTRDTAFTVYNDNMETARKVMTISGWSLLGVMALGIAEAQWHYQPERVVGVRQRTLPPEVERPIGESGSPSSFAEPESSELEVQPVVAPTSGGVFFGLSGNF